MSKNDGGPAFPMIRDMRHNADWDHEQGMTLRDYFAAKAMAAIIAKSPFLSNPENYEFYDKTAIGAYDYADAMLKVRDEEPAP